MFAQHLFKLTEVKLDGTDRKHTFALFFLRVKKEYSYILVHTVEH